MTLQPFLDAIGQEVEDVEEGTSKLDHLLAFLSHLQPTSLSLSLSRIRIMYYIPRKM